MATHKALSLKIPVRLPAGQLFKPSLTKDGFFLCCCNPIQAPNSSIKKTLRKSRSVLIKILSVILFFCSNVEFFHNVLSIV